jgi:diaminohydroxyphosphoribosylaminopyrimidine deaminase/5-amino-6-(5-phosphoribosylamino)uracil reductase
MVGAVVVYNDKIIGEGYHQYFGGAHAEVNAIKAVKDSSVLSASTLYVNLEPCSHLGKTPPCSDLIIGKKIKKVVIGTIDPNSVVSGKGIERLRNAGVEVIENILSKKCYELNKRFFTYHRHKRPYIILKWAQSRDGYIDILRTPETPIGPNWISNPVSRMLVHKWRSVEQAVMVGTNTVVYDNPSLDNRFWTGNSPLRVVLDRTGRIPEAFKVFDGRLPTLVFTETDRQSKNNLEFIHTDFQSDVLTQVLQYLYNRQIQSVLIEGGRKLIQSFIDKNLWDEALVFTGHSNFNSGIKAPQIDVSSNSIQSILSDKLIIYQNR